jgi:DNA-binding response OmpR family regulator
LDTHENVSESTGTSKITKQTPKISMQSKKKKLLVVDDDEDILEFLKVILEEEGYIVITTDKDDYLEKLHNKTLPDLILLDLLLSGKDGRDIVTYLKMQENTKHIPIIMFSAHPNAQEMARNAGVDDFVAKPFEIGLLLNKIAQYLK